VITDFDPSPPSPYSGKWKKAARADKEETPRFATYQAPGGKPIPFIQDSFNFRGGQSVDTADYPFHGYWSNESLNEKPQRLTIEGFARGADYIAKRNALVQALRVKTDDDNPGYVDLPFWGRFPVVVTDYEIGEKSDEQGQCSVSFTFTRAGVTLTERLAAMPDIEGLFEGAKETLKAAAIEDFADKLKDSADSNMLVSAFFNLKSGLLDIVGRVQAEKTRLAVLVGEVSGFTDLINQGIRAPKELADAFLSSAMAIAGSIISIGAAARETYGANSGNGGGASRSNFFTRGENNAKNVFVSFLAASNYTLNLPAATAAAQNTKEAAENLYRAAAFIASNELLLSMEELSYQKTINYWNLLQKLEASIDRNNPAVHAAIEICASRQAASVPRWNCRTRCNAR
jgi:prophage DNA circulation protein